MTVSTTPVTIREKFRKKPTLKAHIILAHPESKSFNGRLCELSRATLEAGGYEVTLSDLYAMEFDPSEGAHHYTKRADAERFHAQTEQRYNADHDGAPVYSPFVSH